MFEKNLELFYKEQSHPDWQLIRENLEEIKLNEDEKVVKSYTICA